MENTTQNALSPVKSCLDNGMVMLGFPGYASYDDFMIIYDIIGRILTPDTISYSVDSLCIMGNFRKDGILVRISDEGITENECVFLFYSKNDLTEADCETVDQWARLIFDELRRTAPRG
ncbi:MAG: hypothetical protein H6Q60_1297 [Oscillospiraceae bacterium]|nr:hypothetical protein [Oscillospiraceae bacterium]